MIINHNCCIKLVPLVIFIYDARSHIHQMRVIVFGDIAAAYSGKDTKHFHTASVKWGPAASGI